MNLLRACTIALIIIAVCTVGNAMAAHARPSGASVLLAWLAYGAFLPFGTMTGAVATQQRGMAIVVILATILTAIPCDLVMFSHALAPLGLAVPAGLGIRALITQGKEPTSGG